MKTILPTLKQKKRYVVFEIISNKGIKSYISIKKAMLNTIISFIGELGMAEAGIILLDDKYNPKNQRGIIKVAHRHVDKLKSALLMVRKIGRSKVIVRSVGISGILQKAEQKYLA